MFSGRLDWAIQRGHGAAEWALHWAQSIWRHSFRVLTILLVTTVIFTAVRQVPSPGSKGGQTPQALEAYLQDAPPPIDWPRQYAWLSKRARASYQPLINRTAPPDGFTRATVPNSSFADWLRHLPVATEDRAVTNSKRQNVIPAGDARIAAVIDLQPGAGNLLLAPAMMVRLRAEYLWATKNLDTLAFHYTSGHEAKWTDWTAGQRPTVKGKLVTFQMERPQDDSRDSFCSYLETLFRYTTVYSLFHDTEKAADNTIAAGDMFVITGRAAHAVMVLDVAMNPAGRVKVLLGQGGNPAQTFHILRADDGCPWFSVSKSSGVLLHGREALRLKDMRHWKT